MLLFSPSIVAVPWRGVNWLRGELVSSQGGGAARRGRSQGVGAVQGGGRGTVTSRGALLLRLFLKDGGTTTSVTVTTETNLVTVWYNFKCVT